MRHYQAANTLIPMELPHGQQLFLQQGEANSQVFKNTFHGDASENSHNHHLLAPKISITIIIILNLFLAVPVDFSPKNTADCEGKSFVFFGSF